MFVKGIPFLIIYGRGAGLIIVEWIPNRMKKQLALNLTKVLQLYAQGGLYMQTILMDMEFENVRDLIPQLNIA